MKILKTLKSKSICDSNCIFSVNVIKMTAKTVTIWDSVTGSKRCKIHTRSDGEKGIYALGQYSMAPFFRLECPK